MEIFMSRLLFLAFSVLVPLTLCGQAQTQNSDKDLSAAPFGNAMEALQEQKFDDALDWFKRVSKDFPDSANSLRAQAISLSVLVAKEVAALKILNLYEQSLKWSIDKKSSERGKAYSDVSRAFQSRAQSSADVMIPMATQILDLDKKGAAKKIELELNINTQGWDVSALRETLKKGELLDSEEVEKLYKGELVSGFLAYLSEIINPPPENILLGVFKGTLDTVRFYRTLGDRFRINATRIGKGDDFARLSRSFYEKVLDLTKDDPYGKERNLASKGLESLDEAVKVASELPKCPKCGKKLESGWRFCPFDGTRIAIKK
jgi:hypothetical protein